MLLSTQAAILKSGSSELIFCDSLPRHLIVRLTFDFVLAMLRNLAFVVVETIRESSLRVLLLFVFIVVLLVGNRRACSGCIEMHFRCEGTHVCDPYVVVGNFRLTVKYSGLRFDL